MRYLLVAVLILTLAAPAVLAGKDAVKAVKGKQITATTAPVKAGELSKQTEKKERENVQYRIVTLLGGKLSARVPIHTR